MKACAINKPIFAIGLFYSLITTCAFGWNLMPQSVGELLADGIACVLFAMSFSCPLRAERRDNT